MLGFVERLIKTEAWGHPSKYESPRRAIVHGTRFSRMLLLSEMTPSIRALSVLEA